MGLLLLFARNLELPVKSPVSVFRFFKCNSNTAGSSAGRGRACGREQKSMRPFFTGAYQCDAPPARINIFGYESRAKPAFASHLDSGKRGERAEFLSCARSALRVASRDAPLRNLDSF